MQPSGLANVMSRVTGMDINASMAFEGRMQAMAGTAMSHLVNAYGEEGTTRLFGAVQTVFGAIGMLGAPLSGPLAPFVFAASADLAVAASADLVVAG